MSNNTPPAWVRDLSIDLNGYKTTAATMTLTESDQLYERIIMRHAPDAEALAVALEELLNITDLEGAHVNHNPATCTIARSTETLAAYRARFPKEQSRANIL